ncbi:MAG: hypothetical protein ACPGSL_02695 [Vicingaceae bacterium]
MKRKNKILTGLLIAPIFLILFLYLGWSLAPGSYARAEIYELDIPEKTLIKLIEDFKNDNPTLDLTERVRIPNGQEFYMEEGRQDSSDHWYSIYFYYPDKNQIVKTWTRPKTKNSTSFAFVGLNDGLTLGNWKDVNESFFWWKNTPMKDEFEKKILDGIIKRIK